jgi:hypothetical protein
MIDKDAIGTVLNCILCCITLSFRGNSTLNNSVFLTLNSLHNNNNNNINRTLRIVVTRSTKIGTLLSTKHLMPRAAVSHLKIPPSFCRCRVGLERTAPLRLDRPPPYEVFQGLRQPKQVYLVRPKNKNSAFPRD